MQLSSRGGQNHLKSVFLTRLPDFGSQKAKNCSEDHEDYELLHGWSCPLRFQIAPEIRRSQNGLRLCSYPTQE